MPCFEGHRKRTTQEKIVHVHPWLTVIESGHFLECIDWPTTQTMHMTATVRPTMFRHLLRLGRLALGICVGLAAWGLDGTIEHRELDYSNSANNNAAQIYAYELYLPPGYTPSSGSWPILIQVHGVGHEGNGTNELSRVAALGAMNHVTQGRENAFRGVIIVAPQQSTITGPQGRFLGPEQLAKFIMYLKSTFRVDPNRVLLTGWSAGAGSSWNFVSYVARNDTQSNLSSMANQVAGFAPVCGLYDFINENLPFGPNPPRLQKLPIWNFHNLDDGTVIPEQSRLWLNGIARALHRTAFPIDTSYTSNVTGNYPGVESTASYSVDSGWTWNAGRNRPLPTNSGYPWFTMAPTGGHNSWDDAYAVIGAPTPRGGAYTADSPLWAWLFAQVNTAPTVSTIANRAVAVGQSTGAITFTVTDPQTWSAALKTSVTSSNQSLVAVTDMALTGDHAEPSPGNSTPVQIADLPSRTLTITPKAGVSGRTTITVTVSDGILTGSTSFQVTAGTVVVGDATGDGQVTSADLDLVKAGFGKHSWNPGWTPGADLNNDGRINVSDLDIVVRALP